jgi:hypothetical protein
MNNCAPRHRTFSRRRRQRAELARQCRGCPGQSCGRRHFRWQNPVLCALGPPLHPHGSTVATVGWNEDEAGKAGLDLLAHSQTFRLLTDDERSLFDPAPTLLKILIQSESRQIYGVHVIGRQAAEIVNLASVAIRCQLTLEQLLQIPLVHPSATEAIQECANNLGRVEVG